MNATSAQQFFKKSIDAMNRHDAQAYAALYAPDAVVNDPQYTEPLKGREAIKKDVESFFKSFPDLNVQVVSVISEGDRLAGEATLKGTHKGPLVSPSGDIPATNKTMNMRLGWFIKFNSQGQPVEDNRYYDLAGMMQQLGLMNE